MTLLDTLRSHSLLTGRGKQRTLLQLCHAGRLVSGVSVSLRATPDEVVGPLAHRIGGRLTSLKVIDVRIGQPLRLDVEFEQVDVLRDGVRRVTESWEVEDVSGLVHNLNDLARDDAAASTIVVLGDWEDMLQLWPLPRRVLRELLDEGVLDEARNVSTLRALTRGD